MSRGPSTSPVAALRMSAENTYFAAQRDTYFVPLSRQLRLSSSPPQTAQGYAQISGAAGSVRVFFEYDRGPCTFAVGASTDARPLCTVDEISLRFPRIRQLPEGLQRLTLDEQSSFVISN